MTDLNILNNFEPLEQPAIDFTSEAEIVKYHLEELADKLELAIASIKSGIKTSKKLLSTKIIVNGKYVTNIPMASIEVLNEDINTITDDIFKSFIVLSKFNSYKKYHREFVKANNREVK